MQLNGLVLRLALLLLPGLLGSKIYRKLRGKTDKQSWEDFTEVLLFSIISYLLYFGCAAGFRTTHDLLLKPIPISTTSAEPASVSSSQPATPPPISITPPAPFEAFIDDRSPLDWKAIVGASLLSLLVAFTASMIATRQVINRIGFWTGATGRQGDARVWTLFNRMYASPTEFQWAFVRDSKSNVVYFGQIRYFSDPGELHELVLHDVTVYKNDDGQKLYELRALYVARNAGELSIEFPVLSSDNPPASNQGATSGERKALTDKSGEPPIID